MLSSIDPSRSRNIDEIFRTERSVEGLRSKISGIDSALIPRLLSSLVERKGESQPFEVISATIGEKVDPGRGCEYSFPVH